MGRAGILLVRRAVGDVAVDDDQRRAILHVLERLERPVEHFQIVGVADASDVPSVADEARSNVVAEGPIGVTLDRDLVVVVDPAKV